jgi:hypothetical protein
MLAGDVVGVSSQGVRSFFGKLSPSSGSTRMSLNLISGAQVASLFSNAEDLGMGPKKWNLVIGFLLFSRRISLLFFAPSRVEGISLLERLAYLG